MRNRRTTDLKNHRTGATLHVLHISGPVHCGLGLIQSRLRIQPSQAHAGEHLRLFLPRRPRLLRQGKRWKYGGSVPTSNKEIYDDDFELLWPATYAQIGKSFGGASVINMAKQPGDLQFLCTDSGTSRTNKITHVTMVASPTQIVHARGTKYGVCTNSISLYAGKVCGVVRYNPACALRLGMKGYRTLRLQQALNLHGADISEDGEFGEKTQKALKVFQADHGREATGETDLATLNALGLNAEAKPLSQSTGSEPSSQKPILVTGGSVHIRTGPGKEYASVMIAHAGDVLTRHRRGRLEPHPAGW